MNKKTVLPKLRFDEFSDYSTWDIKDLGAISIPVEEKVGGRRFTLLSVTAGEGLVSQVEKFGREIAGSAYKNYYVIRKGEFAYNKSATKQFPEGYIAMLAEFDEAALPNSIFICFRITDKSCYPAFFDQLFQNNYHGKWLRKYIEIGARAHGSLSIDAQHLWRLPLAIPPKVEQEKISDCFSSLDDLIHAEIKKLNALQEHKQGLMQKLFPAKEGTVPQLRFAEFSANSIEFLHGNELFESIHNKEHSCDLPLLAITQEHGAVPREQIDYKIFVTDKSVEGYKVVEIGDFIISLRSFQGGIEYSLYRGLCSPAYVVLRKKIDLVNEYYKYYFKTQKFIQSLNKNLEGIRDGKMVSYSQFSDLLLPKPNKAEQEKVAQVLLSFDALIAEERKKLNELRIHKKGLMQKLYPSIEEVCE